MSKITFLNPKTCGIYKDGGPRYKTDPATGRRTNVIDNELIEQVNAYLEGKLPPGGAVVGSSDAFRRKVLVPAYYDERYNTPIRDLTKQMKVRTVSIGELLDDGTIGVRGGHGSPGNDQRSGHIPYVKVSDIRGLRVNINPTNLVTDSVARRFWRGTDSGLRAWDVITPNRASSNIGEFAILLPGEEQVVLTKEVFIFRVLKAEVIDAFYLLWALSLKAVREQWRRVALMQTNREDCGSRYREVLLPKPPTAEWATEKSKAFREYFQAIAQAKTTFLEAVTQDGAQYVANVRSARPTVCSAEDGQDASEPAESDSAG